MKFLLSKGRLYIDGNEVKSIIFKDGVGIEFPIQDLDDCDITESSYIKNVISPGTTIITGGSFHLGDK